MIIGVTGTLGAGKGTVSDFLISKGFKHYSVREFIAKEIEKRGLPVNRNTLVEVANDLRERNSPSFIAEQIYDNAKSSGNNCIIESLRTPGEINALRNKGDFALIAIDADPLVRYERISIRQSETDKVSFVEFISNEQREMTSIDPNKQNLSKCIEMADFKIINNGSFSDLKKDLEIILEKIIHKDHRPSWDEYFMEISRAVAKRATCDRGKSGCVIVKDKRILVTGYVGSPVGVPHCDEVGHQMKTVTHEDGSQSQHCVRTTHAEQNAICQAAKIGISIDGATLYCKMTPCDVCAKMIINSGIKRVICEKMYHGSRDTKNLFDKSGIKLEILYNELEKYENQ
ncbi:AAA family ATPase [Candidatus Pacearchaeota archaeon]|nr:AAA family ATPase [Candidatus Pacearchaeota archaeon]